MPALLLVAGLLAVSLAVVPNPVVGQPSYHHSVSPEDGIPPNATVHGFASLSEPGKEVLIAGTNGSHSVETDGPVPEFEYGVDHSAWTFVSLDDQLYIVAATTSGETRAAIEGLLAGLVGVVSLFVGIPRAYRYWRDLPG